MRVIPLTFILGFYVSFVIGRWWNWFMALPWPDEAALLTWWATVTTHSKVPWHKDIENL
jgi:hypothetical protein